MNEGLVTSLNAIREAIVSDGKIYGQDIPVVNNTTTIGEYGSAILDTPEVFNEWCDKLVKRIVYVGIKDKTFNSPLEFLEGEMLPLGYAGQEIHVNPVKPRRFNVNDFAGLLRKYEADVKVQYTQVNEDLQYPLTIQRDKVRTAFTSWDNLNAFIEGQINAIYNGAYITRYKQVKGLIGRAFGANRVQYRKVTAVSSEATGKALIEQLRADALNFKAPSDSFNAWKKVGGYGNAVITWSDPQDLVLLIDNSALAKIDVEVLSASFNMDKADFLASRVIGIDSFDVYDDEGNKLVDGSKIICALADRSWFNIRTQEFSMDADFYNSNNRTRQYYLNDVRMVNYSLFANCLVYATDDPVVHATSASFVVDSVSVEADATVEAGLNIVPFEANDAISYSSSASTYATVAPKEGNSRIAVITGVAEGSATVTATVGSDVTATVSVTVTA